MKRAIAVLVLVLAAGTAPSGATFTTSSTNSQTFGAASDFAVHVSVTPPGAVRGTFTLQATASETAGGTITQVVFQRAAPGGSSWTTICTDNNGAPWQCAWATSGNGQYDLRAVATSSSGYTRISQTVANVVVDNSAPSIGFSGPSAWFSGTLSLAVTGAADTGGSGFAGVTYEYKTTAGSTWTTACSSTTGPGYSCSFNSSVLTNGQAYDFRATAADGASNQTAVTVTNRRVDNALPSGSLTVPSATYLRGTVAMTTSSVTDAHSGVASVAVQYAPTGTSAWSNGCVALAAAWGCSWDTTTATSELHDLRIAVTDVAGNTYYSPVATTKRVDNVLPTVSLALSPTTSPLSGTITFNTTATDDESGMKSVQVSYSASGAAAWTPACALDTAAPWQCTANSAGVPDGVYDFRSAATDNADNVAYSYVTGRRVDNFTPSGSDVQTADGGGTPGVIQPNDTMTLTYSEAMDPTSIIAGWNGSGEQDIYVRMAHHNQGDRLMFYNSANTAIIPLAGGPGVVLEADYVPSTDAVWTAKLTTTGASFTVRLVAKTAGNVQPTAPAAAAMNWTPASGARDMAGKASTTTVRTESGAADTEF